MADHIVLRRRGKNTLDRLEVLANQGPGWRKTHTPCVSTKERRDRL